MRVPNLGEIDLLVPLHEGMFERPLWRTFLDRLRSATSCEFAMLMFRPPGSEDTVELSAGTGPDPIALKRIFDRRLTGADPLPSPAMREGRVYTLTELVELGGEREQRSHEAMLLPSGLKHMRSVRIGEAGGIDAWLAIASKEELPVSVSNLLSALVPHLRVALRVLVQIETERGRAAMSAGVFSHIRFGWIAIDRQCRIVDLDEQADRFLAHSGSLARGPHDRLSPTSTEIDRQLTAIVREFSAKPDARPRAINLSQDPWIDILVSPARVDTLSPGSRAVAVVYFRGEEDSTADRCRQLADVFNLNPSEARFAWSLAQGLSICDASQAHGLTIETGRNYSKKIYSKTGSRGQVDLMRRVLTSVIALTSH